MFNICPLKSALDKLFATIRSADREQQINKFKNKVSSMREAGDKRLRTEREKLYNRVKQLEQEIQTLENNIGFFSMSKNSAPLVKQMEERIAQSKEELKALAEQIRVLTEAEEQE